MSTDKVLPKATEVKVTPERRNGIDKARIKIVFENLHMLGIGPAGRFSFALQKLQDGEELKIKSLLNRVSDEAEREEYLQNIEDYMAYVDDRTKPATTAMKGMMGKCIQEVVNAALATREKSTIETLFRELAGNPNWQIAMLVPKSRVSRVKHQSPTEVPKKRTRTDDNCVAPVSQPVAPKDSSSPRVVLDRMYLTQMHDAPEKQLKYLNDVIAEALIECRRRKRPCVDSDSSVDREFLQFLDRMHELTSTPESKIADVYIEIECFAQKYKSPKRIDAGTQPLFDVQMNRTQVGLEFHLAITRRLAATFHPEYEPTVERFLVWVKTFNKRSEIWQSKLCPPQNVKNALVDVEKHKWPLDDKVYLENVAIVTKFMSSYLASKIKDRRTFVDVMCKVFNNDFTIDQVFAKKTRDAIVPLITEMVLIPTETAQQDEIDRSLRVLSLEMLARVATLARDAHMHGMPIALQDDIIALCTGVLVSEGGQVPFRTALRELVRKHKLRCII